MCGGAIEGLGVVEDADDDEFVSTWVSGGVCDVCSGPDGFGVAGVLADDGLHGCQHGS